LRNTGRGAGAFKRTFETFRPLLGMVGVIEDPLVGSPYERNLCNWGLESVIREKETKTASATPFDFKSFATEFRELSNRHQIKLVSVGAMSGLDSGGSGTTWLAIWADGNEK